MWTIFSCRRLVVLVCAHLCWKFSEGAVFPCSKNDTQFGNRKLEAGMGGTVSFKFCAENSVRVFGRINISHPNHRHVWYPQQVGVEERLQVNVTTYHRKLWVTVTVTKLQPADFNETFSVTLFAAYENGTRINDSSTFFFVIEETGAVFPCSKNDTQFENRTLEAGLGGRVSFKFCAENSVRVFRQINISHPRHRHGWYPQPVGVEERLQVQVTTHHRLAFVHVTVTKLQPGDFNGAFSVTLFAADENGARINDTSTFFFVIEQTGNDTTVLTTPSATATTAAENIPHFLTDLTNTTTGCDEQSDGRPRLAMCRVTDDVCLTVFGSNINLTPKAQCSAENSSHIADFNSIDILKPCLTYLLLLSRVPIVRLDETRYIDIQNWAEVRPQAPYRVACLLAKQQLADPVITWFTLQRWDDQRETILWEGNLLDRNNTSVVIPATNATLNVTCRASGYPKPQIVILLDNEALEVLPDGVSLQLSQTFYLELICQANNVLTSRQTHIRVLVSATGESLIGKESLNKTGDLLDRPIHSVVLVLEFVLCSLLVVMLLVIPFLCLRKKVNREHTRDVIQGQEEIPMVASQTGSNTRHEEYSLVDDSSYYSLTRPQ